MSNQTHSVGIKIKEKREIQGMSLEDLSLATELSVDVLESIENGDVAPSLNPLSRIARALGSRIGTFLDDEPKEDPIIIESGEHSQDDYFIDNRTSVNDTNLEYLSLASGKIDRHMEPLIVNIEFGKDIMEYSHEGEEFIFVLEGVVKLNYGQKSYNLNKGDSAYYDSIVPHKIEAKDKDARILAVLYAPLD